MLTHSEIFNAIATFMSTQPGVKKSDFNYIGPLPKMDKRFTLENFSLGQLPALGAGLLQIDYGAQMDIGAQWPLMLVQCAAILKDSGADMQSSMDQYYGYTQALQDMLKDQVGAEAFGISDILAMRLLDLSAETSFVAKVEKDRRAFYVVTCAVELQLSGI